MVLILIRVSVLGPVMRLFMDLKISDWVGQWVSQSAGHGVGQGFSHGVKSPTVITLIKCIKGLRCPKILGHLEKWRLSSSQDRPTAKKNLGKFGMLSNEKKIGTNESHRDQGSGKPHCPLCISAQRCGLHTMRFCHI